MSLWKKKTEQEKEEIRKQKLEKYNAKMEAYFQKKFIKNSNQDYGILPEFWNKLNKIQKLWWIENKITSKGDYLIKG
jgi:hypothetical protein|tara:strand:+ start:11543 stop:11773 length:231 start_codon:yes stop_codon:yes gene_type:complete